VPEVKQIYLLKNKEIVTDNVIESGYFLDNINNNEEF